jgi:catechol-2,3-dioxygenase
MARVFSWALYLSDPDELPIEVYADRPRETWQYREGELGMMTHTTWAGRFNAKDLDGMVVLAER